MEKESINRHVKPKFESDRSSSVFVCVRICQTNGWCTNTNALHTQKQMRHKHIHKSNKHTNTVTCNVAKYVKCVQNF